MDTDEILQTEIIRAMKEAGASRIDPDYWEKAFATLLNGASRRIDALRLDLGIIEHAATVGPLTTHGYRNVLEQVKQITRQAIGRI